MDNLELINKLLYDFVNDKVYYNKKSHMHIFDYTNSLKKIMYDNLPNIYARGYKKKIKINDSIKKAREFFLDFDPDYAVYFDLRLQDGTFEFESVKEANKKGISTQSFSGVVDGKRVIKIFYNESFEDVYTIIHELFHDTNLIIPDEDFTEIEEDIKESRGAFTEVISFLGTNIAREYFLSKNEKEADINIWYDIYSFLKRCNQLEYAIDMVNLFIEKGCITRYDLFALMEGKSEDECKAISNYLEDVIHDKDLNIFYIERYLSCCVLAFYIMNKYDDPSYVLKELNEMLTTSFFEDIFNYLDIGCTYDDDQGLIDFDDNTKKILSKAFKQEIKKI